MPSRKLFLVLFVIILSFSVFAEDEFERWPYISESVDVSINISSGIIIQKNSPNSFVKSAEADVSFIPQSNYRQEVMGLSIDPTAEVSSENYLFVWDNPSESKLDFKIFSNMRSYNKHNSVRSKVAFPTIGVPQEIEPYLQSSSHINSDDPRIQEIASDLAEGEDDLFVVTHKIAQWVKTNIEYNLTTVTADVSQPASWVLENRQGVCDELTSLFIAMLRSIGVPAKFISGVAYTNLEEFDDHWGGHGWAEVYFPGYGWVDWDVTYGQFGWIDPTHFKLREGVDSDESVTTYTWQGTGIDAIAKELSISTVMNSSSGRLPPRVSIDAVTRYNSVGFGSYNLIEAEIINPTAEYVSEFLQLVRTKDIEIISEQSRNVLLKPNENKSLFWIVKVKPDLDSAYIYTFPISVVSLSNASSSTSFIAMKGESIFTRQQLEDAVSAQESRRKTSLDYDVNVLCEADAKNYYVYEIPKVECEVHNSGNAALKQLHVCLASDCEVVDLKINQKEKFTYYLQDMPVGQNPTVFSVKNADIEEALIFDVPVSDVPEIKINSLEYPENVSFSDKFNISLLIGKSSNSLPRDVKIKISSSEIQEIWTIEKLEEPHRFNLELEGGLLKLGNNTFKVVIEYKDSNLHDYTSTTDFVISVPTVTFSERVQMWLNSIDLWLRNIFK